MHFPAILAGFVATAAAAATPKYQAPQGTGPFQLQVIATSGSQTYSGGFLGPYHTGAGSNALVYGNAQQGAQTFSWNKTSGQIYAKLGDYPYTLSLTAEAIYSAKAPAKLAGFNVGDSPNHFTFSVPGNYLHFGPSYANDKWAICPEVIYTEGVYIPSLVYAGQNAALNKTCSVVKVKAVF